MKPKHRQFLLIFSILIVSSIYSSTSVIAAKVDTVQTELNIAVSIVPFVEWVQEVGGDHVNVLPLIPNGQSPHTYAPSTTELTFVSNADAWFQAGLIDFDKEHETAILSSAGFTENDIVNFSQHVELLESGGHDHESPQTAQTEVYDPHIWLSPTRAITSIGKIVEKLSLLDPSHASEYALNGADYILELTNLNNTISTQLSSVENRHMLVFHPSWGYFAHDFNLELIALEEEGKEPSSKHYVEVLEEVELHKVGVIFIQEQISVSMAQSFAVDACVEVVQINPLPTTYIDSMNETSAILVEKLDQSPVCKPVSKYITWIVIVVGIASVSSLTIVVNTKKKRK